MILIDGYNLLRTVERQEDFAGISDVQLCITIAEYLRSKHRKGRIVFDGIGPPDKSMLVNHRGLEVIFSGTMHEADDIIEELIATDSAPRRLLVVSSDRKIRGTAGRHKAVSVPALEFWIEIISSLEKFKKQQKQQPEPPGKLRGITVKETEAWMKEFGLE